MVFHACMANGFVQRFVAVAQINVFAHHGNAHFAFWMRGFIYQIIPALQIGRFGDQAQLVANQIVQTLLMQDAWYFVNRVNVPHADDSRFGDVTKQGDFGAFIGWNRSIGTA